MVVGTQILLIAVFGVIGLAAGALVTLMLTNRSAEPGTGSASQTTTRREDEVRLWHDEGDQKLVVEVNELPRQDVNSLSDTERERLTGLYREWSTWLGAPTAPAAIREESPNATPYSPPPELEPIPMKPAGKKKTGQQTAQHASIVQQIDDILQEMLNDSPLQVKGIKLVEDLRYGVVVWIGLEHFNGIDAVTDQDAKALIQAAAAEWEHRTGSPH